MIRLLWWLVAILALSTGRRSFPFPQAAVEPAVTDTNHDTEPEHGPEVTDLLKTDENPILTAQPQADDVEVWVAVGLAESPNGRHAIRVKTPANGVLTAAQADKLQRLLGRAAPFVADIRRDAGYTS